MRTELALSIMAVMLMIGCGGSTGSGSTTAGGSATRGATSSALTAANSSAGAGATSQSLIVQALRTQMKGAAVTTEIPDTELTPITFPCASGSGTSEVTISGEVTVDNETGELISLDFAFLNVTEFDTCVPEDIASTTDIDESDYSLDGLLSGVGTISGDADSISFDFPMDGTLTIGGACSGELVFDMTVTGSLSGATLVCEGSGTIAGTVCGEVVSCTLSGECGNPTVDC